MAFCGIDAERCDKISVQDPEGGGEKPLTSIRGTWLQAEGEKALHSDFQKLNEFHPPVDAVLSNE